VFDNIEVYAGENAKKHLLDSGLKSDDIKVMAGAAGGPKFLVLTGIDHFLFGHFFKGRKKPLHYLGSSIGSFRAAALGQKDPIKGIEKFTTTYYLEQKYSDNPDMKEVSREAWRITDAFLSDEDIDYLIEESFLRINFFSTRFTGLGSSDNKYLLGASLLGGITANKVSRSLLFKLCDPILFSTPGERAPFYETIVKNSKYRFELTRENFKKALNSSGAIPYAMEGIRNIPGTMKGTFRDGGVCHYHLDVDFGVKDGIVLFPHFFNTLTPGWLDKKIKSRKPKKENFSNTIMICPSQKFIDTLPDRQIPDRKDFFTYIGRDDKRIKNWETIVKKSHILGEELAEAIASNKIKDIAKDFNF